MHRNRSSALKQAPYAGSWIMWPLVQGVSQAPGHGGHWPEQQGRHVAHLHWLYCRDRIKRGQFNEQNAARVIAEILRTIAQVSGTSQMLWTYTKAGMSSFTHSVFIGA